MVCMGNICRSPTAEAVLAHKLREAGLHAWVRVDSAGTHAYHVGSPPDERSQAHAARRGYELSALRARQVSDVDFVGFDLILAMDRHNLAALRERPPTGTLPSQFITLPPTTRHAIAVDEDVAGLQVAMHDQMSMGVLHAVADLAEQRQARPHVQLVLLAVVGERHAVHVFHHQVGDAAGRAAAVQDARHQSNVARPFEVQRLTPSVRLSVWLLQRWAKRHGGDPGAAFAFPGWQQEGRVGQQ